MRFVFTGGGSGGHFYPLIAVAEELRKLADDQVIVQPDLFYLADQPYDEQALANNKITYYHVPAGKLRIYFSVKNGWDFFKTLVGLPRALILLMKLYPDVVFSKGGYSAVPVLFAARILRIPIFIHESDTVPGRTNLWSAKFAERIGIGYPEAAEHFQNKDKIALTGNPIRAAMHKPVELGVHDHFHFSADIPTVLILGGSQGADTINTIVLQALPQLVAKYQVIHQVGEGNYEAYHELVNMKYPHEPNLGRYRVLPFLSEEELRFAAGAANIILSRAGSSSITEIALWEKPAILVPIPINVSRDQRQNAYAYSRAGGAFVIEQENFSPHVFVHELDRIINDPRIIAGMREGAKRFVRRDAASVIARELLRIGTGHER